MKKFFILFCLLMACFNVFAQKSYVNVCYFINSYSSSAAGWTYLSGDIPSEIKNEYDTDTSIGTILNLLSEQGYEVEFMCTVGGSANGFNYLLSKKTSSYNSVRSIEIDDEEVTEIARYNLQGLPVKENEKGVQIIVYSNYTTKTIIVQ